MVSTVDVDAYIDTAATNGSLVTTVIVTSYVRSHPETDGSCRWFSPGQDVARD